MKVFISHSSIDKRFVRTLKDDLDANGIDTFFDEDSLELGDSLKEKLDSALDESSHFVIILSPHSVNSNWVKYELTGAVKLFAEKTLKKIIPIKYRECDLPNDISGLLYADLSNEIVKIDEDKVKFISNGYDKFLNQLIGTLKNSDKLLNKADKSELLKEVNTTEKKNEKILSSTFQISHRILGFKDAETIRQYQINLSKHIKLPNSFSFRPIVLPSYYKFIINDLKIGDNIHFSRDGLKLASGTLAGFQKSGTGVTLDPSIRKFLNVQRGDVVNFTVAISKKLFVITGNI